MENVPSAHEFPSPSSPFPWRGSSLSPARQAVALLIAAATAKETVPAMHDKVLKLTRSVRGDGSLLLQNANLLFISIAERARSKLDSNALNRSAIWVR